MPAIKAVRVRTATGWQDIALTGPAGAPGPAGPPGPPGPSGSGGSAYWSDPVATFDDLPAGTVDGQIRLVLEDPRTLYTWVAGTTTWEPISGGGGLTGDFITIPADLTGLGSGDALIWDAGDSEFEPGDL